MVAERQLVAAEALRRGVEDAAAQPRAQRAVGRGVVEAIGDHRVGVLGEDLERPARRLEPGAQGAAVVARLALIEAAQRLVGERGLDDVTVEEMLDLWREAKKREETERS